MTDIEQRCQIINLEDYEAWAKFLRELPHIFIDFLATAPLFVLAQIYSIPFRFLGKGIDTIDTSE